MEIAFMKKLFKIRKNRLGELLLILFYGELPLKSEAECAIAVFSIYQNDILLSW